MSKNGPAAGGANAPAVFEKLRIKERKLKLNKGLEQRIREGVIDPYRLLISFLLVIAYPRVSLESQQRTSELMSFGIGIFDIGLSCWSGVLIFVLSFCHA